jgi:hypothetical protein
MLAVSAYADGKGSCPWELAEALFCEDYGIAPQPGALEGQDAIRLLRYGNLKALYRVCMRFNEGGMKALSGSEWRIYAEILRLEYEHGANHNP